MLLPVAKKDRLFDLLANANISAEKRSIYIPDSVRKIAGSWEQP